MFAMILSALLGVAAADPPDPVVLLTKAGERYFALQSYSAEVKQQSFNPGVSMSSGLLKVDRDGDRWRIQAGKISLAVGNGDQWWIYSLDRKTYYSIEAGPEARRYKELAYRSIGRFEKLGLVAKGARFLRWEKIKRDLRTYDCAVVELRSSEQEDRKWVELLWIDPEEYLVLRSNFEVFGLNTMPSMLPGSSPDRHPRGVFMQGALPTDAGTMVSDYRWMRLDAPEEALFRFEPPKGSRQVKPPKS